MSETLDIQTIFTAVAESLDSPGDLDETLLRVTRSAVDNLPGVDFASISILHSDGTLETSAATDPVIERADTHQYELHEGPCYEAVTDDALMVTADVGKDPRWPRYGPRAADLGMRAQAAVSLFVHDRSRGALNLYSTDIKAFEDPEHLIELFARQASVVLGFASEVATLNNALLSRKRIGQAIGIVMERYHVNEDRAFGYLVRVSQTSNTRLREVAEELVGRANTASAEASRLP
jgi:GAF domain-containing protein